LPVNDTATQNPPAAAQARRKTAAQDSARVRGFKRAKKKGPPPNFCYVGQRQATQGGGWQKKPLPESREAGSAMNEVWEGRLRLDASDVPTFSGESIHVLAEEHGAQDARKSGDQPGRTRAHQRHPPCGHSCPLAGIASAAGRYWMPCGHPLLSYGARPSCPTRPAASGQGNGSGFRVKGLCLRRRSAHNRWGNRRG
jgi:hypothetical protein